MSLAWQAWQASFTKRWHTDPDLSATNDPISGHQCRVAILALKLEPNLSREAIIYALTHDLGEHVAGDISNPAKDTFPQLREITDNIEKTSLTGLGFAITVKDERERQLIKLCDRLDAFMWQNKHTPTAYTKVAFQAATTSLLEAAKKIGPGVVYGVNDIFNELRREYRWFVQ